MVVNGHDTNGFSSAGHDVLPCGVIWVESCHGTLRRRSWQELLTALPCPLRLRSKNPIALRSAPRALGRRATPSVRYHLAAVPSGRCLCHYHGYASEARDRHI